MRWLCSKLFGWEYWYFNFGHQSYVRRAHVAVDGTKYVKIYDTILVVGSGSFRNWMRIL